MSKKTYSKRWSELADTLEKAQADAEAMREDYQTWYDNMPDGIREGSKGDEVQERIDSLDEIIDSLTEYTETAREL